MPSSFDYIAPYYDALAFLVYGNNLKDAKRAFLNYIPKKGRLLLMGGGTGNILNELLIDREELTVDFIDSSERMVGIAKEKLKINFRKQVRFIYGDHRNIPAKIEYDAVTSFFVIDCLKQKTAEEFTVAITKQLKAGGVWLFADFFHTKNYLQQGILWFMYRFFKITAGISASRLPDYNALFKSLPFEEAGCKKFLGAFIQSKVYTRQEDNPY